MSDADFNIRVPFLLWRRAIHDLRTRGRGQRESGAFLLGVRQGARGFCTGHICYDDLDPNAYQHGGIAFHATGCAALWTLCRERKLEILADVHTHPGDDTRQSPIDQRNPMLPIVGHTAMIVQNYAHAPWWSLRGVGVYEYMGNFAWRTHDPVQARRVQLTLW